MSWNHRVWRECFKNPNGESEEVFTVKEAYYNKVGEICACTEGAATAHGYTLEELRENLQRMDLAAEQPILEEEGFVFAKAGWED